MTDLAVLTGFGGSGEHLALLLLVLRIQYNEATVAVLTVLVVSAVMAVSVMTATPLKVNPPFSVILILGSAPRPLELIRGPV